MKPASPSENPEGVDDSPLDPKDVPKLDVAVMDDDKDFCQYMEDILSDEGHTVRFFQHPTDLFRGLSSRRPDVVFLDMKMGEFRGEEVLADLRKAHDDLCVIILTGYPSLDDMRATFRMQVFDYLAKPFSLTEFRETLSRAVSSYGLGQSQQERLRERLGHRIKVMRTERKWGLKDLAHRSGVSISQLSSIERGTHMPSMESLLAICNAFEERASGLLADIGF